MTIFTIVQVITNQQLIYRVLPEALVVSKAGMENALSRVYVGYHFRNASKGLQQDYEVGKYVFENYLKEQ